jgi:hypothetical protein
MIGVKLSTDSRPTGYDIYHIGPVRGARCRLQGTAVGI